ncbi:hypothetical protein JL721_4288 [Aureococcus anophagefferens]|nr:hypothetical protein JL721_4288 [Aureococcus anophagefferens]
MPPRRIRKDGAADAPPPPPPRRRGRGPDDGARRVRAAYDFLRREAEAVGGAARPFCEAEAEAFLARLAGDPLLRGERGFAAARARLAPGRARPAPRLERAGFSVVARGARPGGFAVLEARRGGAEDDEDEDDEEDEEEEGDDFLVAAFLRRPGGGLPRGLAKTSLEACAQVSGELRAMEADARARRRLAADPPPVPVSLNLACANRGREGWLNVSGEWPGGYDLDLRKGLAPLADGSCAAVASEHFLEHLSPGDAAAHLRECRRALRPGGELRVAVPDAARHVAFYRARPGPPSRLRRALARACAAVHPTRFPRGDDMNHEAAYDERKLAAALRDAGFGRCERRRFDPEADVADWTRAAETLYMVAYA